MYDTFTIFKIYIPCESQFEPGEIFLKKKPRHGSYPTLGANKEFLVEKMKRILDSMVKGMLRTES
jgi:hypothetical protein